MHDSRIFLHVSGYLCTSISHVCMYTCTYVCMYIHVCMYVYVRMYVRTCVYLYHVCMSGLTNTNRDILRTGSGDDESFIAS